METCKGCIEKQRRIDQLENASRMMAESADKLERRLETIKAQQSRLTIVRKSRTTYNEK